MECYCLMSDFCDKIESDCELSGTSQNHINYILKFVKLNSRFN